MSCNMINWAFYSFLLFEESICNYAHVGIAIKLSNMECVFIIFLLFTVLQSHCSMRLYINIILNVCAKKASVWQGYNYLKNTRRTSTGTNFVAQAYGPGGGGARATQNFYGRAKINAKFGQNIKVSGKFRYVLKKYLYLCENYVMLGKMF